jgi:endonuclease G
LSEREKDKLEAIVIPNGLRPSFDVADDSFAELPEQWTSINAHRTFVNSCIRGVGRVDVPGHAQLHYAGTGFIVGPNVMLTNRHVAQTFCQTGGSTLTFTPGIVPSLDLKQEAASTASVPVSISEPVLILTQWDAALFRLAEPPAGVIPLRLAARPASPLDGRLATIIGYPALDTRGSTEELLQQMKIFRAIFDKKRLQPGRLTGFRNTNSFGQAVAALAHDCSTLGGNSGSALLDIDAETIVGLHFGGQYLVSNYAVPSWELAGDQRLHDEGVLFG